MDDAPRVDRDTAPDHYGRLRVRADGLGPARWLTERTEAEGGFGRVAGVSGPGFAAYARLPHPAALDGRPVRWADLGAAYGRPVGPRTRWHELIGTDMDHRSGPDGGLPGVWDEPAAEGPTPPEVARALIPVLARHTATAGSCWFGLWHGYGRWDFGRFPVFSTPGREEVLLSGALEDAVSPVELDEFAELPDLWWPEDRAWCVGGDVDLVSTYVGGSPELIADLLAAPGLEAYPVGPRDLLD
ncbi:hypothetical protein ACPEIF_26200 [Streptomyces sp. NPDC012600]|uniref:Knr4/Smi1-like domain-containing protein n=1 Tax=Streptomyces stephensoniae TaxID=3375367 RepID=A0ABU2WA31_9ACTN|nr:hypothetical protein [Streptomyces griseus]MDT0494733.1 hypothetical protein [Streptomyces griseus]